MYKENGFTLLEMLIVLVIWSVLILFIVPINFDTLEKQQEKEFFKTLEFDVLYAQNLSTSTTDYVRINVREDSYIIRAGNIKNEMIKRDIPEGWIIDYKRLPLISFDHNGRMKTPGNFLIKTKHSTYKIIFPFGKGRFYVVEE